MSSSLAEQLRFVQPTIFVGLGHVGIDVLIGIRQRMLLADWGGERLQSLDTFPKARFVFFDPARKPSLRTFRETTALGAAAAIGPAEEAYQSINAEQVLKNIDAYPHIKEWFSFARDLQEGMPWGGGVYDIRMVSRFSLFQMYHAFKHSLLHAAKQLTEDWGRTSEPGAARSAPPIRVVIVASSGEGDGSGTCIDAGLMVKTILPGVQNCNLALVCAPSRPCPPFSSNTYALLSELEYVSADTHSQPYAPHGWTGLKSDTPPASRPFDRIELFDTHTPPHLKLDRNGMLVQSVCDSLFQDIRGSAFGERAHRLRVNQLQHQHQLYHPPMPMEAGPNTVARSRWYSATGYAAIVTSGKLAYEAAIAGAAAAMIEHVADDIRSDAAQGSDLTRIGEAVAAVKATATLMARRATDAPPAGSYVRVIDTGPLPDMGLNAGTLRTWAKEALAEVGGLKAAAGLMDYAGAHMELFNRFLTFAERQTADLKARIPTALQTLLALPQEQQARELEAALQLAAPRVALDPKHPSLSDEQLRITIAVKDDGAFRDAFGKVIAALGVTIDRASRPDVVEHHDGGEILFGSDLTGLPLDSLSHIRELHGALEKATERHDAFPVFNHPDLLRFPTPMAPSVEEVRKSIDDMQLYLRGVLSGCLVRAPGSGRYSVSRSSVGAADTESVGGERVIRRRGFTGRHQAMLEPQLAAFEETLAPVQLLALATLFEWTAYRAYAPRLFHHRGMDERRAGLAATAALKLARDYEARFDTAISILAAKARANGGEPPQLVRKQVLREQIAGWTVEIADSVSDADASEVDMEPGSHHAAVNKRRINPEMFSEATLRAFGA